MANSNIHRLGDLQLKIMKVLWERAEATVSEVHETLLCETNLAYTTIATMLRKMEARGLVRHRLAERKFLYSPKAKANEVANKMSAHFIEGLFEGSLSNMVSHLLKNQEISREELDELARMIAERKKQL